MKYVGNKEENIEYRKRPGAYAIIINKDDDKIGIVATEGRYFYLGGGIEKGETKLETLKRELLEESGYTIKNIKEFDKKVTEPIEKDHTVLWVKPEEYVSKMFREWQSYIMKRFIEERKQGKFYV